MNLINLPPSRDEYRRSNVKKHGTHYRGKHSSFQVRDRCALFHPLKAASKHWRGGRWLLLVMVVVPVAIVLKCLHSLSRHIVFCEHGIYLLIELCLLGVDPLGSHRRS